MAGKENRYFKKSLVMMIVSILAVNSIFFIIDMDKAEGEEEPTRSIITVGPSGDYTTVGAAFSAAQKGDTIQIAAGTYSAEVQLTKENLTITGAGEDSTYLVQKGTQFTFDIASHNITIRDIHFKDNTGNYAAIQFNNTFTSNVTGCTNILIEDCSFSNMEWGAIDAWDAEDSTFQRLTINDTRFGINLIDAGGNFVDECSITNMVRDGIYIQSSDSGNHIRNCDIGGSGYWEQKGIVMHHTEYDILEGLTVWDMEFGIFIERNVYWLTVKGCYLHNNSVGLRLEGNRSLASRDLLIYDNHFKDNVRGIVMRGTQDSRIMYNHIENSKSVGLEGDDNTKNVSVIYNNFKGNKQDPKQAWDLSSLTFNSTTIGNYWSDHTSPDSDSNGIVDSPYVLTTQSKDHLPKTTPFKDYYSPRFVNPDQEQAYAGWQYSVQYEISTRCPWTKDLVWEFDSSAPNLTFTSDHKLIGNFAWADQGLYSVYISVTDGISKDTAYFTLNVTNQTGPHITTQDVLSCYEDQLYSVDYDYNSTASLTWELETNATFLSMNSSTGVLSGTPDSGDIGTYWVEVTLWATSVKDQHNFTLTVFNTNDDPYITSNNVLQATIGSPYSVTYSAVDQDGDPLVWALSSNASFLSINSNTGILSGTPSSSDIGTYWIYVSVNDGNGGMDFTNFTLTVDNTTSEPEYQILVDELEDMEGDDNRIRVSYDGDDEDVTVMWFIEGIGHMGNGTEIILDLEPGTYNLTMRVIDSENNIREISTTIIVKDDDSSKDSHLGPLFYMLMLALIFLLVIGILSIVIYRKQKREFKVTVPSRPQKRPGIPKDPEMGPSPLLKTKVDVVGGSIDDFDPDIETSYMGDEDTYSDIPGIGDIIAEAGEMDKYTDFVVSKKELLGRARESYEDGDIPKEIYLSIREQFEE